MARNVTCTISTLEGQIKRAIQIRIITSQSMLTPGSWMCNVRAYRCIFNDHRHNCCNDNHSKKTKCIENHQIR